jgi:glutamyl-tRNA reductase
MMLLAVGCSHRTAPVAVRERLAFDQERLVQALDDLVARYGCEAVILSTCNRVELYLARAEEQASLDVSLLGEFLGEFHELQAVDLTPHLYEHRQADAVRHLFRVATSLDSLVIGESQIAGQVRRAYELAHTRGTVGPVLHTLYQHAHQVAKRVRSETGITRGHASIASAAVDYVRQVFDHFGDKTILVIGAGKMGGLTLRHLRDLAPRHIWVTNRSPEKAAAVAGGCSGTPVPWEKLDDALARADIVLSTTGAGEPIMTRERYQRVQAERKGGPVVILDIAVPRDFDPRIHDGERTCLFNIDDLKRVRERTLRERRRHLAAAEAIVTEEQQRFFRDWGRRQQAPVIARLTRDLESKREEIVRHLFQRLNGRVNGEDRAYIEGAFRLLQNQFLHGPLSALAEDAQEGGRHALLDALRKLFRISE